MGLSDNNESPKDLSSYGFQYVDTFPLPQTSYILKRNDLEWKMTVLTKDDKLDVPPTIFKKIQDASTSGIVLDYWLVGEDQFPSHTTKVGAGDFILLAGTPISGGNIHWYEVGMWFTEKSSLLQVQ